MNDKIDIFRYLDQKNCKHVSIKKLLAKLSLDVFQKTNQLSALYHIKILYKKDNIHILYLIT